MIIAISIWWWYAGAGYVLLMILIYLVQDRFIFKPEKLPQDFVYKYNAPFREVNFDVEEGVRINGIHFFVEKPHGLILYFHGNTRSIKGWGKYARDFYRYNYDVILVDYRGFGKSTGKRNEEDMLQDMQVVYEQLTATIPEDHLILYGRSMGSGFACKLASDNKPRFLILDAPYFSFLNAAKRFLPLLPGNWLLRYHLRTDKWIKLVNCHTYILHGTKDWLIPIKHSVALQNLNPGKITLIRIHGGGHNNLPTYPEYHAFIRSILLY
ncbi:MAG: alpha/beta fold hydrolase [Bacteroidota bacterium]